MSEGPQARTGGVENLVWLWLFVCLQSLRLCLDAIEELGRIPGEANMKEHDVSISTPGTPGASPSTPEILSLSKLLSPQERMRL